MVSSSNPQPTAEPVPNSCHIPGAIPAPSRARLPLVGEAHPQRAEAHHQQEQQHQPVDQRTQSPELSPLAARCAMASAKKAYMSATTKTQKERRRDGR